MKLYGFAALLLLLAPAACGDDTSSDDGATSSGSGGASSTGAGPGSTSTTSASTTTSGSGGSGGTGGGASEAATVESDDGNARLVLPEGALPEGVTVDDITVTAIAEDEAFADGLDDGWSYVAGYRLGPDGITLGSAARLEVGADVPPDLFIWTGMLSNQGAEMLENDLAIEPDIGATGYAVDIPHFSEVLTVAGLPIGNASVRSDLKRTTPNGPTPISVRITPILVGEFESPTLWTRQDRQHQLKLEWETTTWTLDGFFLNDDPGGRYDGIGESNLLPENPKAPPEPLEVEAFHKDLKRRFTCKTPGEMKVRHISSITVPITATWTREGADTVDLIHATGWLVTRDSTADCAVPASDAVDDFVDSISSNEPTYVSDVIDMNSYDGARHTLDEETASALYEGVDAVYPCGDAGGDAIVACSSASLPMPAGDVFVFTSTMVADVPHEDEGHSFIHSVVLDSDGFAENNWSYNPPYDWDLFQGADRWYQLIYDHASGEWIVTASQVADNQSISSIPTTARAIVQGTSVTWHISAGEFEWSEPRFRTTSFGHDGSFSASDRGADVSGANPTQALHFIQ